MMTEGRREEDRRSGASGGTALERHAQTLIGIVVASLLGWVGVTVQDLTTTVARMEEKIVSLERQIDILQSNTRDRYTKQDASRDFGVFQKILDDHAERIRRLERKDP